MSDLEKRFLAAQKAATGLRDRPDNDIPSRAKYDALAARKGLRRDVAIRGYVKLVERLQLLED